MNDLEEVEARSSNVRLKLLNLIVFAITNEVDHVGVLVERGTTMDLLPDVGTGSLITVRVIVRKVCKRSISMLIGRYPKVTVFTVVSSRLELDANQIVPIIDIVLEITVLEGIG